MCPTESQTTGAVRLSEDIETLEFAPKQRLVVWYTNWRGVRALRRIDAQQLWFGSTAQHPAPQWLLTGRDLDKDELRDFAVKDMEPLP